MPTPIETVTQFCARASEGKEGLYDAIRTWFTPQTIWVNTGLAVTTGIAEALDLCDKLEESMAVTAIDIEILAIAANGNTVLTERIDRMINARGEETSAPRCMGIFEVEGDKITAWRDYFDTAAAFESAKKATAAA